MTAIEERLAALEARNSISELRAAYCWHTTRAARDALVGLFTSDGVFENTRNAAAPPVRIEGRPALIAFFARMTPARRVPLVMNEVIRVGGDRAEGTCAMMALGEDQFCGHYIDEFRKADGRWLFSRRRFFPYWPDYRPDPERTEP
jgi:SnoaL-like domain